MMISLFVRLSNAGPPSFDSVEENPDGLVSKQFSVTEGGLKNVQSERTIKL